METITFYSYKGGVGRTLVLANIAMYLRRFGLNVCLLDFDLEAPGLHYKFIQNLKPDDIKSGLLDYIYEFTQKKDMPDDFVPFSVEILPKTEHYGSIRLIPAGNVLSPEYWYKLAAIDWCNLFYKEDSEGVPFFLELKEKISKELNPDFLLIDSRTGVTEMGGVCTALLPDKVIFLIINNQENIDGARQILKGIKNIERLPEQKPVEVFLVLTRIPSDEMDKENQIVTNLLNYLNEDIGDLEKSLTTQDICVIHSDRELELSESLRFSKDNPDPNIDTLLICDYNKLFMQIIPEYLKEVTLPYFFRINEYIKKSFSNHERLLQYYNELVDKVKDKANLLKALISDNILLSNLEDAEYAKTLLDEYTEIVSSDIDLRIKKVNVIYILGKLDELNMLLDEEWVSANDFLDREPKLFFSVMKKIGKENVADDILTMYLMAALSNKNYEELYRVCIIYYKLRRKNELKEKMAKSNKSESSIVKKVLEELENEIESENDIPF